MSVWSWVPDPHGPHLSGGQRYRDRMTMSRGTNESPEALDAFFATLAAELRLAGSSYVQTGRNQEGWPEWWIEWRRDGRVGDPVYVPGMTPDFHWEPPNAFSVAHARAWIALRQAGSWSYPDNPYLHRLIQCVAAGMGVTV